MHFDWIMNAPYLLLQRESPVGAVGNIQVKTI